MSLGFTVLAIVALTIIGIDLLRSGLRFLAGYLRHRRNDGPTSRRTIR